MLCERAARPVSSFRGEIGGSVRSLGEQCAQVGSGGETVRRWGVVSGADARDREDGDRMIAKCTQILDAERVVGCAEQRGAGREQLTQSRLRCGGIADAGFQLLTEQTGKFRCLQDGGGAPQQSGIPALAPEGEVGQAAGRQQLRDGAGGEALGGAEGGGKGQLENQIRTARAHGIARPTVFLPHGEVAALDVISAHHADKDGVRQLRADAAAVVGVSGVERVVFRNDSAD